MGKYTSRAGANQPPASKRDNVHPIMRGIGCIMMVIVPILSYGVAVLLVNYGAVHGWPIPPGWLGTPGIYPLLRKLQGLAGILDFIQRQTNLIANLVFAIAITVVVGGFMSVIYGYIYSIFGPPRYGPTDAPPQRVKVKKYTR